MDMVYLLLVMNSLGVIIYRQRKGIWYRCHTIDGNNILEVYSSVTKLKKEISENPKPVILECMTFRMRGHEEISGTKYVPKDLMKLWIRKIL